MPLMAHWLKITGVGNRHRKYSVYAIEIKKSLMEELGINIGPKRWNALQIRGYRRGHEHKQRTRS